MSTQQDTQRASSLPTQIDFQAEGKQVDWLHIPYSVNRSAYGTLPAPLACIKNGEGPTVLFMAGVHGDEFEGQICLSKLIRDLQPEQIKGRVIILPMSNFPAAKAGARVSPLDDANLNRVFPGETTGTVTRQIAQLIETGLMPMADYVFDLHSGGTSLHYRPTTLLTWVNDHEDHERQFAFAKAFGTEYACFFAGGHNGTSSSAAAYRQGATGVTVELGGSARVSADALACCESGIQGLMGHVGVLRDSPPVDAVLRPPHLVHAMHQNSFVLAPADGVFEPHVALGDAVKAGDSAGLIHNVEFPERPPVEVPFLYAGTVICQRSLALTQRGDCLFHLGTPMENLRQYPI